MILLTVGKQLPFDRLVHAMDRLAPELDDVVIAQIGASPYDPVNIEAHADFPPKRFEELAAAADVIVSHAGIGTVLLAQRLQKPIVLVPRRAELGEHRNDHQLATVRQLGGRPGIIIATDEGELRDVIDQARLSSPLGQAPRPGLVRLTEAVARFIGGQSGR